MQELASSATLVDEASFEGGAVTAVLSRDELESMLGASSPGLWFELGYDDDETSRLTIQLDEADIQELLRRAEGDEVVLALDGGAIGELLEAPDVEAHGMRAAIAIGVAVVVGAVAAPTALAASPQQVSSQDARSQVSRTAVSSQVSRPGVESQVVRQGVSSQISHSLVVKANGIHVIKLAR